MKVRIVLATILLMVISLSLFAQKRQLNFGVIIDGDNEFINTYYETLAQEIDALLSSEYRINVQATNAGYERDTVIAALDRYLSDDDIDMVFTVGPVSSDAAGKRGPFPKPVINNIIINPRLQGLPLTEDNTSGVKNVAYLLTPFSPRRDINTFYDIYPFTKVGVMIDRVILEEMDMLASYMQDVYRELGVEEQVISVSDATAVDDLEADVDAVYFGPLVSLSQEEIQALIDQVNQRNIPTLAMIGRRYVEMGVLSGFAPRDVELRAARRMAVMVRRILDGDDPEDLSVDINYDNQLVINMATARQIGYAPSWNILSEAVLLNEEVVDVDRTWDLLGAIDEALKANLDLISAGKTVEAGERDILDARSDLLPQIEAGAGYRMIDEDRANAGFGSNPQHLGTASGSVSQLVFSEGINANYRVQKEQQLSREKDRDAIELDIIQEASEAYLNLMRIKSLERIQQENLRVTRRNLELAELRQQVGYTGPSDLYRWEGELALVKRDLNLVQADLRKAEINLNRVLFRPLSEQFMTMEIDISDPNLITNDPRITPYVDNPIALEQFIDFMVEEGFRNSPELQSLDALIAAQDRFNKFSRRNFYLPTVGASFDLDYLWLRGGVGAAPPPEFGGTIDIDDINWVLGANATLPLYVGSRRSAQYQKSTIELEQLGIERANLLQQLEQRIRSEMLQVGASYANIELARQAESASVRNFQLVQDSYAKGTVSVIQLIDAQNAALESSLLSANAVFEFVIDLLRVERAVGRYFTLSSDEERANYFQRLLDFINR